jgi:RHS repeat-associated protein
VVFTPSGQVIGRSAYLPFGETRDQSGSLPRQRFTGQERDGEAGLDYFNARSLQMRTGRMNQPDPLFSGAMTDPQGWNRYAYVLNAPLTFTDPTGRQQTNPVYRTEVIVCISCPPVGPVHNGPDWSGSGINVDALSLFNGSAVGRAGGGPRGLFQGSRKDNLNKQAGASGGDKGDPPSPPTGPPDSPKDDEKQPSDASTTTVTQQKQTNNCGSRGYLSNVWSDVKMTNAAVFSTTLAGVGRFGALVGMGAGGTVGQVHGLTTWGQTAAG